MVGRMSVVVDRDRADARDRALGVRVIIIVGVAWGFEWL